MRISYKFYRLSFDYKQTFNSKFIAVYRRELKKILSVLSCFKASRKTVVLSVSYFYRYIFSLLIVIAFFCYSPLAAQAQGLFELKDTYRDRCFASIELADYQMAIADCTKAVSLDEDNPELLLTRAIAYYRQGDYQAAIADNNQVISLKPSDFRAYYNRALADAGLGNYQNAIASYNQALGQIPCNSNALLADIYTDRGLARFELADFPAAITDFSLAIRLNNHDSRAYYNRGCVCFQHGDYLLAISDFTYSLQLNPANTQAYVNRGVARHQLGYQQAAIADLQQAAKGFSHQKELVAYQKTVTLLQRIQHILASDVEIADA